MQFLTLLTAATCVSASATGLLSAHVQNLEEVMKTMKSVVTPEEVAETEKVFAQLAGLTPNDRASVLYKFGNKNLGAGMVLGGLGGVAAGAAGGVGGGLFIGGLIGRHNGRKNAEKNAA